MSPTLTSVDHTVSADKRHSSFDSGHEPFDQDGSVNIVRILGFDIQPVITFARPRLIDVKGMDARRVLHAVNLRDDIGLVGRA